MKEILSVTELTLRIKFLLESSFEAFWVEGEISNLRRPASGHVYFTLKDEKSQVRAVLFRPALKAVRFDLEDGMQVILRARLNVYEPRGEYQLICDAAEPKGLGALQKAFEQLKMRLQEEGLFDPAHKKPIPFLPRKIGVITSPSGAVIRDILNVTGRRFPSIDILIAPVRVQGMEAPPEIVAAIADMNDHGKAEVIILARGGGSLEDLAPFNDERVARAIFRSGIPIVSAVGHEIDFTIADFVADLRAPTPSAAAELVVPIRRELRDSLADLRQRINRCCRQFLASARERTVLLGERLRDPRRVIADLRIGLDESSSRLAAALSAASALRKIELQNLQAHIRLLSPAVTIREKRFVLENLHKNVIAAFLRHLEGLRKRLDGDMTVLDSLSPLAVLRRGYSIVKKHPEGVIIRDAAAVVPGDAVAVKLSLGGFRAKVVTIEEG
jgi:exodeoxyribonuclease VII large subunit